MITFKKKENKQLSQHFNSKEFECPCSKCDNDDQVISENLIKKLELVRNDYGKPINVSSGYRCPAHNVEVGGAVDSAHVKGLAADLIPSLITLDDLDSLYESCYSIFDNIGDGRRLKFIHVDDRPPKPSGKRHWIY